MESLQSTSIVTAREEGALVNAYAKLFFSLHKTLLSAQNLEELLNALGEGLKKIVDIAGISLVFRDESLPQRQIHRCFSHITSLDNACQHFAQIALKVFETHQPLELRREDLNGIMESGIIYPLFFHNRVEAALGFFCTSPIETLRKRLNGIEEILPDIGLVVAGYRLWWERELKRRQWETAMEAFEDAVFIVNIRNNRISYSNKAALNLLGKEVAPTSSFPIERCTISILCKLCQSITNSVVRSKAPKDSRFVDENRTFSLRAYPILGEKGKVESVLFILRDVTAEVRSNLNLIKLERLEAISEVLEGVSHSLNNPITAVVGFSQFLLEREDLPEDAREMLRVIEREGKRCAEVVNRLLSFVGNREGEVGQIDINGLVSNIALLRSQSILERGIELEIRLDPNLQFVWGESHAIQQALVNIVLNAEKVVPEKDGIIRISTKQKENEIEVAIEDNGPGIPKEIRETIFSPFFTTDVTKGTGLGLSIALSAVEDHGGRIEVGDSELGGALFRVVLPLPVKNGKGNG